MSHVSLRAPRAFVLGLAVALLVTLPGTAVQALTIDDFTDASAVLQLTSDPGGAVSVGVDGPISVIGGTRTTTLTTTGQAVPGFDTATITYFSNGGTASFADANSQVGWSGVLELSYDLSGLPSVLDGVGFLEVHLLGYDTPSNTPMAITASLDGIAGAASFASGGAEVLAVPFAGIANGDYDDLTLSFTVPAGGDFRIDLIAAPVTVPEPSGAFLIVVGLTGIWLAGRPRD